MTMLELDIPVTVVEAIREGVEHQHDHIKTLCLKKTILEDTGHWKERNGKTKEKMGLGH